MKATYGNMVGLVGKAKANEIAKLLIEARGKADKDSLEAAAKKATEMLGGKGRVFLKKGTLELSTGEGGKVEEKQGRRSKGGGKGKRDDGPGEEDEDDDEGEEEDEAVISEIVEKYGCGRKAAERNFDRACASLEKANKVPTNEAILKKVDGYLREWSIEKGKGTVGGGKEGGSSKDSKSAA